MKFTKGGKFELIGAILELIGGIGTILGLFGAAISSKEANNENKES